MSFSYLLFENAYLLKFADVDGDGDDLLLLMQFPAGEIGRKMALTVSHLDDDRDRMTPGKFAAREFPVGTGQCMCGYGLTFCSHSNSGGSKGCTGCL